MHDAAMAVPPFQREHDLAVVHVEMRPVFAQFADAIGRFAYDHIDDLRIAESFAGGDRVGRVTAEVIQRIEDAGNSPLGVGAVGLQKPVFGNDDHFQPRGNGQCRRMPAIPPPIISTSANACGMRFGSNRTR